MKVAMQIKKAKTSISKGLATQRPAKILIGLALGAVLLTATAMHLAPGYTSEAGSSPSMDQQRAADSLVERMEVQRLRRLEDM